MSIAKAKIAARLIYKKKASLSDFPQEDWDVIRQAYELIYGVEL